MKNRRIFQGRAATAFSTARLPRQTKLLRTEKLQHTVETNPVVVNPQGLDATLGSCQVDSPLQVRNKSARYKLQAEGPFSITRPDRLNPFVCCRILPVHHPGIAPLQREPSEPGARKRRSVTRGRQNPGHGADTARRSSWLPCGARCANSMPTSATATETFSWEYRTRASRPCADGSAS